MFQLAWAIAYRVPPLDPKLQLEARDLAEGSRAYPQAAARPAASRCGLGTGGISLNIFSNRDQVAAMPILMESFSILENKPGMGECLHAVDARTAGPRLRPVGRGGPIV